MNLVHKGIRYVSFDLYDTLIKRSVLNPRDLFVYVKRKCDLIKIPCPENFVELRIKADAIAQRKHDGCATFDEIYTELERMSHFQKLEEVKKIEIDLEIKNANCNYDMLKRYLYYVKTGIPIVFITDMYLPRKVIKKILEMCGINVYERIYISSELRASKGKGNLFDYVLSNLKIKPYQLYHIGDNKKGDWIIPAARGIRTELVKCNRDKSDLNKFAKLNIDCSTISSAVVNLNNRLNFPERLGCMTLGPVLFGFTDWLKQRISEDSIDSVLFMSRDGYIMKKAFEKMTYDKDDLNLKYVYCSRRAFTVPLIWKCSTLDEIRHLIPFPHKLSLRQFASRLGIDLIQFDNEYLNEVDLDKEFEKFTLFEQPFFKTMFNVILEKAIANSINEFESIKLYFSSLRLKGNVAIVDIGYHGTMQYALENLLKEMNYNVHVTGYYLDIAKDISPITEYKIEAKGYLDDVSHQRGMYSNLLKFLPLFELGFLSPHGSTKKFMIVDNKPVPVLFPFEYNERYHDYLDIKKFQSGAIKLIDYLIKHGIYDVLKITPETAMWNYNRMGLKPTLQEAIFWGNKVFFEYDSNYIARPKSFCYYMCHYKEAKKDFLESFWKIGFLKRLIRIKFPYKLMFSILKKIYYKDYK